MWLFCHFNMAGYMPNYLSSMMSFQGKVLEYEDLMLWCTTNLPSGLRVSLSQVWGRLHAAGSQAEPSLGVDLNGRKNHLLHGFVPHSSLGQPHPKTGYWDWGRSKSWPALRKAIPASTHVIPEQKDKPNSLSCWRRVTVIPTKDILCLGFSMALTTHGRN